MVTFKSVWLGKFLCSECDSRHEYAVLRSAAGYRFFEHKGGESADRAEKTCLSL